MDPRYLGFTDQMKWLIQQYYQFQGRLGFLENNPVTSGVVSFNTRTGPITLGSTDIFTASGSVILKNADLAAQSAIGTITTFTTTVTGTYQISGYLNISAIATNSIRYRVSFTDLNNGAQNIFLASSAPNLSTFVATGFNALNSCSIRALTGTTITIATVNVATGGNNAFDVGATITQLN